MQFSNNIIPIKIAVSEAEISKTIEELLELNKKIPKRTGKEIVEITEKQLAKTDNRGEADEVTEKQFGKREEQELDIIEVQLGDEHDDSTWNTSKKKMRGHENISPLWIEVFEKEDQRNPKEIKKTIKIKK